MACERVARCVDAAIGLAAWGTLTLTVLGAVVAPRATLRGVTVLAAYVAARTLWGTWAAWRGAQLVRHAEKAPLRPFAPVHHLILLPSRNEPLSVLQRTLSHLAGLPQAHTFMLVLAMEAAEPAARAKAERLRARFEAHFGQIWITVHPADLPHETAGKAANLRWALRQAQQRLAEQGIAASRVLVSVMDADTLWHPRYFQALGAHFAAAQCPQCMVWQAPIRYHANVWSAHPLMRVLHAYAAAWELAYLAAPCWEALPMASYSLSLPLLAQLEGWDADAVADDWRIFLQAYIARAGELRVQPIFLPFYVHATDGATLWETLRARYRQTLRHAWGAKEIGYLAGRWCAVPELPPKRTAALLARMAHDHWLAGAGTLALFLGVQLPWLLHPQLARAYWFSFGGWGLQAAFAVAGILSLFFWLADVRARPLPPHPLTWRTWLAEFAGVVLLVPLTLCCVAVPVLHAQTRLLLGRALVFHVTPKR